jgi:hypothetical protein
MWKLPGPAVSVMAFRRREGLEMYFAGRQSRLVEGLKGLDIPESFKCKKICIDDNGCNNDL